MKKLFGLIFVATILIGGASFLTNYTHSADPGKGGLVIKNDNVAYDPGKGGLSPTIITYDPGKGGL